MSSPAAPNPQLALCVPCGPYQWVRTAEQPNCMICTNPPTYVIEFSPFDGAPAPGTLTSPEPASANDAEPVVFHETCPKCETEIVIEISDTQLTVTLPPAPPAGAAEADEPIPLEAPGETAPASTISEGGDRGTPPAASPPSPPPQPAEVTS